MTDYSWELQERSQQKSLFESHRREKEMYGPEEGRNRILELKKKEVEKFSIFITKFYFIAKFYYF